MVGVGESTNPSAAAAGSEVAAMAMAALDAGDAPGWALVFGGGQHDGEALVTAISAELPGVPLVGGAAVGTITGRHIGSTGYECAMALFPASLGAAELVVVGGLDVDERAAGVQLGARLRDVADDDATVLLFYDSVKTGPPPQLHIGSRLLNGLYEGLGDMQPSIAGAGTLCDLELADSYVLTGNGVARHTAVAVVIPSSMCCETTIMHGCEPVSSFLEITRIEGATVHELDHRPATDVLAERLGVLPYELSALDHALAVTLGKKHGDPFAPYDESRYVNRMVVGMDPDAQTITLFEADFEVGTKVQVMVSDVDKINASARAQTDQLLGKIGDRELLFGLYIDCAGRSPTFCGSDVVEAISVQTDIGARCPLLGFYSGVEIAPLLGKSRPLDWTGVLSVFSRG